MTNKRLLRTHRERFFVKLRGLAAEAQRGRIMVT